MKRHNKFLIILLIMWSLGPMLWQVYTSFCKSESLLSPLTISINSFTLQNYIQLLSSDPPFWKYIINSTFVGSISTLFTLALALPAAYSLNKLSSKTSRIFKYILTITALFPYVLLFLSLVEIAKSFNLGNNLIALALPYTALSLPIAILLLSSAFAGIPHDLEEAARIEGLNIYQRLRYILVPLISPATASTAIIIFLFSWNEFPISLTWISRTDMLTLPVAISRIAGSSIYSVPYGAYAAATVLGSIPLLLVVILFQKQIISGLTQGAVKG